MAKTLSFGAMPVGIAFGLGYAFSPAAWPRPGC